jgi:hyperosmotically inducible periplasmic protein
MKTNSKLVLMTSTLLGMLLLTGCNKPQESVDTSKADSAMSVEVIDADVSEKVKTALLLDETVKGFDITVETTKGDVGLTGVVDNQAQLDHIDQLVRAIEGVHSMHNDVTLKEQPSLND